jgi:hypothetical protein
VKNAVRFVLAAALVVTAPLFAQSTDDRPVNAPPPSTTNSGTAQNEQPRMFRSELRLQYHVFGNFFQAPDNAPQEDVNAISTQYRATIRPWARPLDLYAHVDFLHYTNLDRDNSYGGRIGAQYNGEVHSFDAYVDRGENRASFDVGDRTAIANITSFGADYSYRITKDWQVAADVSGDQQRFTIETGNESDYNALGASVRYRGFGRMFSPRVGYVTGHLNVANGQDDYDDQYWYLQVISVPMRNLYLSVRYRQRDRDYETSTITSPNFGRHDDRAQWVLSGNYRLTDRLGLSSYFAHETVDSSRPGRDYDANLLLLGLTIGF